MSDKLIEAVSQFLARDPNKPAFAREEVKELEELSKDTLQSYAGKVIDKTRTMPQGAKKQKHLAGYGSAMDKMDKKMKEEVEFDEDELLEGEGQRKVARAKRAINSAISQLRPMKLPGYEVGKKFDNIKKALTAKSLKNEGIEESWPGTPEWKKKHDSSYNPYDPEGKQRKTLKQMPYGYRSKSVADNDEETPAPARQSAMKKKMKEDFELEEGHVHSIEKQSDGSHHVFYKDDFDKVKHIGTIHPPIRGSEGRYTAKHKDGRRMTPSSDIEHLAKQLSRYHSKEFREEVEQMDEKISVVPAGTPSTGVQRVKTPSGGTITTGSVARGSTTRPAPSPMIANRRKHLYGEEYQSVPASKALQKAHDDERKKRGLPDPSYYLELMKKKKKEIEDMKKEEIEQVSELKTSTVQSYVQKRGDRPSRVATAIKDVETGSNKSKVHSAGLKRAQTRLNKLTPTAPRKEPTADEIKRGQSEIPKWWTYGT